MTSINLSDLRRHIGTRITDEDVAAEAPLKAIVATFDREEKAPAEGEAIPQGWHIGYFLSTTPTALLAPDGSASGSGLLPKLPLPRRMYAGARIAFHQPLRVGDRLRRESELTDLQVREGSTGTLILATQSRRIFSPRGLAIAEAYDIVFREGVKPGAKSGIPKREEPPADLAWRRTITPNPVNLFRFSALTGNPHRIHYDRPYAMEVEGYPGLVVHGPFTQTCLINFIQDHSPGRPIRTFAMRARAPLFDTAAFDLVGRPTEAGAACEAWAVTPSGTIAMHASATFG
ncbi:MAG TPA: MaoC family dehydratase N-terminal domain-containing protein [Hyphomicrobiaceae bacterium]|jgi:3-methylfumaryl-CoA hydratase